MQFKTVLKKVYLILCYEKISKIIVVLQNCINLLKVASDSETCHAGVQAINIKVEELTDVEKEKSPVPITKVEHEVSCVCVYIVIHISEISSIAYCLCHLHSGEWNLRSLSKNNQEDSLYFLAHCMCSTTSILL
jgi:hypothetical protein